MDLFWESVNARKTFVCALYRHEKQLPKTALGSQGAAPGAANVWLLPMALLGWQLPEMAPGSRKWLPSCSCVEPFFWRLWWLHVFGPTPQGGSRSCQCVSPRGGLQSQRDSSQYLTCAMLVFSICTGCLQNLLECYLGRVRFMV